MKDKRNGKKKKEIRIETNKKSSFVKSLKRDSKNKNQLYIKKYIKV